MPTSLALKGPTISEHLSRSRVQSASSLFLSFILLSGVAANIYHDSATLDDREGCAVAARNGTCRKAPNATQSHFFAKRQHVLLYPLLSGRVGGIPDGASSIRFKLLADVHSRRCLIFSSRATIFRRERNCRASTF